MPTVVVPFRGENAKRRLEPAPAEARQTLAEAMLDDVLDACHAVGREVRVARAGLQGEAVGPPLRGAEGGLGGSRFALALAESLGPGDVTVIGNVGDDLEVAGLHVSPDLDTIVYTLAGLLDAEKGWGRADESWNARAAAEQLGAETWFQLGDRDLGLHLARTESLRHGEPLSAVTARIAAALGVQATVLPATDDRLRTWIATPAGEFPFQEWFVRRQHRDEVD